MPHMEFIVSQNGHHMFTTKRKHMTLEDAHTLYEELRHAFPTSHRFNVQAMRWEEVGHDETDEFEEETA